MSAAAQVNRKLSFPHDVTLDLRKSLGLVVLTATRACGLCVRRSSFPLRRTFGITMMVGENVSIRPPQSLNCLSREAGMSWKFCPTPVLFSKRCRTREKPWSAPCWSVVADRALLFPFETVSVSSARCIFSTYPRIAEKEADATLSRIM